MSERPLVSAEHTFRCAGCGGVFPMAADDDEPLAELRARFRDVDLADCALVCDDCYAEMVG